MGVVARKVESPSFLRLLAACFLGLLIVYVLGIAYYWVICTFYTQTGIGIKALFLYCFVLAVPGDIFLCFLSAIVAKRLIPVLCKSNKGVNL